MADLAVLTPRPNPKLKPNGDWPRLGCRLPEKGLVSRWTMQAQKKPLLGILFHFRELFWRLPRYVYCRSMQRLEICDGEVKIRPPGPAICPPSLTACAWWSCRHRGDDVTALCPTFSHSPRVPDPNPTGFKGHSFIVQFGRGLGRGLPNGSLMRGHPIVSPLISSARQNRDALHDPHLTTPPGSPPPVHPSLPCSPTSQPNGSSRIQLTFSMREWCGVVAADAAVPSD